MPKLEMPARQPSDGPISVNRPREGYIAITASTDGEVSAVTISEHNAWRVFGCLALMLGIPLKPEVGKAIRF